MEEPLVGAVLDQHAQHALEAAEDSAGGQYGPFHTDVPVQRHHATQSGEAGERARGFVAVDDAEGGEVEGEVGEKDVATGAVDEFEGVGGGL